MVYNKFDVERDQLVRTEDSAVTVNYTYGADGNRASKYTTETETLYFNSFWTWHFDSANQFSNKGGQYSKHIYLGNQRIATVLLGETSIKDNEIPATFYYHTDHLGSASLITDYKGEIYERLEYTPYGETWVDICKNNGLLYLPYKFTGKELDEETGLYYYGARYLDPKYSRWISADPALGEYVSSDYDGPSGGIYNFTNLNLYHYAGNNPIKYIDPDGDDFKSVIKSFGKGLWDGIKNDVNGVVNFVCHPIQTVENVYTNVKNEVIELCSDPVEYVNQKIDNIKQGVNNFIESSPEEKAYVLGEVTEKIAVTVATVKTIKAVKNRVPNLKNGNNVYRVYGGEAKVDGASWTTKNPKNIKNYRNKAGLPNANTGENMVTGVVTDSSKVFKKQRALPCDGNKGGLPEYVIPNPYESGAVRILQIEKINLN